VRGTLRLNVPVSFGVREVAPLLPQFAESYPSLVVELGLNDRSVDLIEEGWDLAIRIGRLSGSTMIARRLAPCRTVVCASPAYLKRHGTPDTVAELANHNCLGYTLSEIVGADRWSFGPEGAVTVSVSGTLRANNGDALVAAALAGQGLVYQPTFLVSAELRSGRLVSVSLDHPTIELPGVFVVYPSDRRPPAKVRAFIDFLAQRFGSVPPWDRVERKGLTVP
jgi:DNA-binding transcriptional LysR family regulator